MRAIYRVSTATMGIAFGLFSAGLCTAGDYLGSFLFALLAAWNLGLAK